ncbi:MAG: glycosyltransferase family 2 protein, partial [Muribaculaceae bacterium]|nr:glycosyltransferase family 2 protein [Muribaculaceae bacterium]
MPDIAVIILNWNGEKLLGEFLPSVIANTPGDIATVIVADNGSTDGSLRLLAERFPRVQVLRLDRNYGFAGGYNRAIRATQYRYTLLLNSDVMTPPGWLGPLHRWMLEHPEAGAVMPKIRSYLHPEMFEYAGAAGGYLDRNGYPYCRGRIFNRIERDNGQYDTPATVFWATGAAMLVDTKAYLAVGGLDEDFFAHMEEIDLCWR